MTRINAEPTDISGKEACPGHLVWSAFGAAYADTVCASVLDWSEAVYHGWGLCDADDDFRPKDVPCPFCHPEAFLDYEWGEAAERELTWVSDGTPVAAGTEVHFHDGDALTWSATHPERGEERIFIRSIAA